MSILSGPGFIQPMRGVTTRMRSVRYGRPFRLLPARVNSRQGFLYMANIQDDKRPGFNPITALKVRL
jgi:hypothetical protein